MPEDGGHGGGGGMWGGVLVIKVPVRPYYNLFNNDSIARSRIAMVAPGRAISRRVQHHGRHHDDARISGRLGRHAGTLKPI